MLRTAAACLLVVWSAAAGHAQTDGRLTVGVVERPPFAIRTDDDAWLGLAVDLWRLMAEDLELSYEYRAVARGDVLAAMESGAVDLVLPIDATPELEEALDFTLPVYTATMGVASPQKSRMLRVVEGFASWQFVRLVLGLSAVLLLVGALVWLLERRSNGEQFARHPLRGLGDGFWWAGVTLTTIGYGDKAPVTLAGRAVAMLWMLVGLAVSAALTAAVVALSGVSGELDLPEALSGTDVGTVEGSTAALFLTREDVDASMFPTISDALEALDRGSVEAVAAAGPALSHVVSERGAFNMQVRTTRLDPHYVSVALPAGSELRNPLNVALLRRLTSESGWNLLDRYLPE